jgi:hypothetical protein
MCRIRNICNYYDLLGTKLQILSRIVLIVYCAACRRCGLLNWYLWVCWQGIFSYPPLFKKTVFCYIIIKAIRIYILVISGKQTGHQSTTLWSNYSRSYMFQPHRAIIRLLSKHIKEIYTSSVYLLFKLYSNTTWYISLNLDILLQQNNEYLIRFLRDKAIFLFSNVIYRQFLRTRVSQPDISITTSKR